MSGIVWIRLPGDFSSCWAANILYRAEAHGQHECLDSAAWGFSSSWAANILYCLDADGHWDSHAKGYHNYSLRLVCNVYYNGVRCMMI